MPTNHDLRAEAPIATRTCCHVMSFDITQCHDRTVPKLSQLATPNSRLMRGGAKQRPVCGSQDRFSARSTNAHCVGRHWRRDRRHLLRSLLNLYIESLQLRAGERDDRSRPGGVGREGLLRRNLLRRFDCALSTSANSGLRNRCAYAAAARNLSARTRGVAFIALVVLKIGRQMLLPTGARHFN